MHGATVRFIALFELCICHHTFHVMGEIMYQEQNVGQNYNIKIANKECGTMAKYKCLGMTQSNQNLMREEIKSRLI